MGSITEADESSCNLSSNSGGPSPMSTVQSNVSEMFVGSGNGAGVGNANSSVFSTSSSSITTNVPSSYSVQQFNSVGATISGSGCINDSHPIPGCGSGSGGGGGNGVVGSSSIHSNGNLPHVNVPHSQSAHQLGQPLPMTPLAQQLQQHFAGEYRYL